MSINADHSELPALTFKPLTPETWAAFEQLFGERGACGGCWCMWWRLKNKDYETGKGESNRVAIKNMVDSGRIPGILAFHDNKPVGWCSVSPREEFLRLENSRIFKPVDNQKVWSIVCLFVDKTCRNIGVSTQLIEAAIRHVKDQGGSIVEAYAVEPKTEAKKVPPVFAFNGLASAYRNAGFQEVLRRSEKRPIMRFVID
ncbi:GNAT family N-acetyltransferase [Sansalvadorimonas sp. 2012CJ34-2]|uniref:GNAT family N-acetyltransferase n=1 Tax=Parendozoicomonas callyspongiae TaxID=2942213 RepID=A0ABT0PGN6_9GAMM|nr:GNAT family N-acetyltransferase [Sansalvadorimonas sp. 2012CJ34-2]MCL6269668.1 GNAT family N-acetyltransferase [Sansalvadorimonas sp. 2012CJ34-2]